MMKSNSLIIFLTVLVLSLILSACGSVNLPRVSVPAADKEARDFGDFSGVTVNFDVGLSMDKISPGQATGGGNIWPLFNIDMQQDRLLVQLEDGRLVFNVGDMRTALNFPQVVVAIKFTGGKGLASAQEEKILYVGPNKVACVGVAPQECLLVRENPEDQWKYFYDQIEGFSYEEGFLYELRIVEQEVPNPPADSSSLKLSLVEIINQTAVSVELTTPTWGLESLQGEPPLPKSEITAIFSSDCNLYGSAGCNSYTTRYQVGGETITIEQAATTMMACPQTGVMEQEAGYLAALPEAKTFEIVGYRLSLMNEAGEQLVTYMAEQP
jgi:heat shock protein HslJ